MKKNTFKTTPRHDADEALAARLYALLFLVTFGSFSVGVVLTYLFMR